jgi:pimeloyl-ACP methyl ester carboxylesterase
VIRVDLPGHGQSDALSRDDALALTTPVAELVGKSAAAARELQRARARDRVEPQRLLARLRAFQRAR